MTALHHHRPLGRPSTGCADATTAARPPTASSPATLPLKAAAVASRDPPRLNGFWEHGVHGSGVQLDVALSLRGGGLLTPVFHDAGTL
jgi:pyruvate dehydrogenase E2 component (dihydrolipoamide acetyltransferase)